METFKIIFNIRRYLSLNTFETLMVNGQWSISFIMLYICKSCFANIYIGSSGEGIDGRHSHSTILVFNWNHFEMRLLNLRINFYLLWTFCPHLGIFFFLCCFFFHYVSVKFHLWPSSGDLPRPQIGMLSLVTVSPVITAFQRFTWSKTWCYRQKLWKAVITGDTVTSLSIHIRGRGKSPEEGQRWNLAET